MLVVFRLKISLQWQTNKIKILISKKGKGYTFPFFISVYNYSTQT